jgi:hypothetical protein
VGMGKLADSRIVDGLPITIVPQLRDATVANVDGRVGTIVPGVGASGLTLHIYSIQLPIPVAHVIHPASFSEGDRSPQIYIYCIGSVSCTQAGQSVTDSKVQPVG